MVLDPLGDTTVGSEGFILLPATRLYGEFGRYSNGSGDDHRWNAKTGGYLEFARWDSSWSIGLVGTMEVVMDPLNDISFNPRAIFWEEGLLASARLTSGSALQFGYVHRCKHDIDNLEIYTARGELEQRTLIYSGLTTRYLARPRRLADVWGSWGLYGGFALRNDLFLHLFDGSQDTGVPTLEHLLDAVTITGRLDLRSADGPVGFHLMGNGMVSFFGEEPGLSGRTKGITLLGSMPYLELGLDLFNTKGMLFTIFARGEWQRDGGIRDAVTSEHLFLLGLRSQTFGSMW